MSSLRETVLGYLAELRPEVQWTRPEIQQGRLADVLDSLEVVHLMVFFEEKLGVKVSAQDITEDNFGTLNAMILFVERQAQG